MSGSQTEINLDARAAEDDGLEVVFRALGVLVRQQGGEMKLSHHTFSEMDDQELQFVIEEDGVRFFVAPQKRDA